MPTRQARVVVLAQLAGAPPGGGLAADQHLGDLEQVALQRSANAPGDFHATGVAVHQQGIDPCLRGFVATLFQEEGHRDLPARHAEGRALLAGEVEQQDLLAAAQMVGPLVGRRGLEVTLVEVGGQEREALGQPGVVVAAGKADPGLPVATERAERHRREAAVGAVHRLAELFRGRHRRADDLGGVGAARKPATSGRIGHVAIHETGVVRRGMAAAEGTGVRNVLALERLRDAHAGTEQSRFPLARPMHRQRLAHPADADARGQLLYRPPAGRLGAAQHQHIAERLEGNELALPARRGNPGSP